jgi:hypothetical protein
MFYIGLDDEFTFGKLVKHLNIFFKCVILNKMARIFFFVGHGDFFSFLVLSFFFFYVLWVEDLVKDRFF